MKINKITHVIKHVLLLVWQEDTINRNSKKGRNHISDTTKRLKKAYFDTT